MGLFGEYEDNDVNDTLYDEDGNFKGGGDDYENIQRPLNAVLSIDAVKLDVSDNEGSEIYGQPYFVLECEIETIHSQGEHTPRDPSKPPTRPKLTPGDLVQYFQALPMTEIPPEKWSLGQKYSVRDVKGCVAAIYGVDEAVMDLGSVDQTAENGGERVIDRLVGVKAKIDERDKGRFCNLTFYPVDQSTGEPKEPLSPEETRKLMNQGQQQAAAE